MDGQFARHVQRHVDSRVTQGLEAPHRTSTSHLATDHGSRPPAAQSRSELSLATGSGPRTMEATCGNGYAPVRGMPAMMMMMMMMHHLHTYCRLIRNTALEQLAWWLTVRTLDLRSRVHWFHDRSGRYQVVTSWMGDCLWTGKPSWYITNTKVNSAFIPLK